MAKQKRDATLTKGNIVLKAMLLFSKQGYDATTIDDIARESNINKALIYYYFKNKSGLYSEVMSSVFDAMYEEVTNTKELSHDVVRELEMFIKTYANYAYKHPYVPALLLRELSDSGAHLPEMMFASMRRLFALLSDILMRGYQEGIFIKSIPMVIHFMILGSLNLMITTQSLRKKAIVLDEEVDTCHQCNMKEVSEYIFETLKKSLEVK